MFCPQFAPIIGGAERQAERLGMALVSQGVDVVVTTPHLHTGSPASELRGGMRIVRFPLSDLAKKYPRLRGIGLVNAPWIVLQIVCKIWREIGNADILHCHIGSLQSVAAACAARLRGVPVICKAAMADSRSDIGEAAKAGMMNRLVAVYARIAFTRWVATTEAVRQALLRAGVAAPRIVVIPNGVELALDESCVRQRPVRRFLYLGRLSTNIQRDVPGLLRAFDVLAADVPDAELAVVGGGDLLADTRTRAAACLHAARIRVTGPGSSDEWLQWADCLVLPSRREGLSNALLEAMAAGLPCIAYDIPPNREVLANGAAGVLVPEGNEPSLVGAMHRFVMDAEYASSVAQAGLNRVEAEYRIASVASRYMELYRALLGHACRVRD